MEWFHSRCVKRIGSLALSVPSRLHAETNKRSINNGYMVPPDHRLQLHDTLAKTIQAMYSSISHVECIAIIELK